MTVKARRDSGHASAAYGRTRTARASASSLKQYPSTGDGIATNADLPVAVLINGGSASASEIVAAALKEHDRAEIIGEPSFGKNTVQVWGRLENDGGVRITISRWFTPDHNSVAPDGIQPDIAAARSADTPPQEDPVLDAALAYLADQPVAGESDRSGEPSGSPSAALDGATVVGVVALKPIC